VVKRRSGRDWGQTPDAVKHLDKRADTSRRYRHSPIPMARGDTRGRGTGYRRPLSHAAAIAMSPAVAATSRIVEPTIAAV
jgi:hypothetical protein